MTKIIKCTCQSEFQDQTYGKNNRVANACGDDSKPSSYRCSVCGKEYKC